MPANVLAPRQRVPEQDETVWAKSFYEKNTANPLAPGDFDIPNVPPGDYMLSVWDFDQNNILYSQNVTVRPGEQTDMDTLRLAQWWSWIHGTVFEDTNENGKQDPGEKGIPHQLLTVRERSNALYEHGTNLATTDENGHYELRAVYPLGQWLALEQYADGYKNTGLTWQAAQEKAADHQARRRRSTSTSCPGSARAPPSTGARSPTRRTRTAASSASSPTARPATSSTRTRPSPRTGSPASPA